MADETITKKDIEDLVSYTRELRDDLDEAVSVIENAANQIKRMTLELTDLKIDLHTVSKEIARKNHE